MTDGTSAQLMNQSLPETIARGCVQPEAVRSANFSVATLSCSSIQLRIVPRLETLSCGSPLPGAAGVGSVVSTDGGCAGWL